MRRLLLALPFALLPLASVQAGDHSHAHDEHDAHASLEAHAHGVAQLNAALDGRTLALTLESPAMNFIGFEHEAQSEADTAKVVAARAQLEQPLALFGLPLAAGCSVSQQELDSPLFGTPAPAGHAAHDAQQPPGDAGQAAAGTEATQESHSEIRAHYQFDCSTPDELKALDLADLFKRFPGTEKIQVQLIGPKGQLGMELTPTQSQLSF